MKQRLLPIAIILAATATFATFASFAQAADAAPAAAASAAASAPLVVGSNLIKIDTVVGTGAEALGGNLVEVHYTGWLYDPKAPNMHGKQFDSSVGRAPFTFPLGGGRVIKGWDQGVSGMKVGGKRTLIIPGTLGYGSRGAGSDIPPNATLVFDVELLAVK
jgi:FKBP-type peptidyl-prolyl cis-trans isomerase FkpA